MALPREFIQDIKDRISVSDVVGRKVRLTRRGKEYVGLSPFKSEKTPSFTVNDQKQFYHCFASGKHGSIFDFLMETEGVSFIEAVERLANEAGMTMPARDPKAAAQSAKRASLAEVMEIANIWFQHQLSQPHGEAASAYLEKRGVNAAMIKAFGIGFAPSGKAGLVAHLQAQKIPLEQMVEANLATKPDDGSAAYDRFRDRIMFPIKDRRDKTIAFGGRAMSADAKAKYLNSSETPLFHKGSVLYNFAQARQPAYDTGQVLVCEGYMDVVGLARGDIMNAVASLGTAITENQIGQLWQLAPEPIICMDGDEAGLRAAYRVIDRALPLLKPGFSIRFAQLPAGKDPDDVISESGREGMVKIISNAKNMVDMLWERELAEIEKYDTPERAAALKRKLRECVGSVGDKDVRTLYGQEIAKRLDNLFGTSANNRGFSQNTGWQKKQYGRVWRGNMPARASRELLQSSIARDDKQWIPREMQIILCVLTHPTLLINHSDIFRGVALSSNMDNLRFEIIDFFDNYSPPDKDEVHKEGLDKMALTGHLERLGFGEDIRRLEALPIARRLPYLQAETPLAEVAKDWLEIMDTHHKLKELENERAAIEQELGTELGREGGGDAENTIRRLTTIRNEIATLEHRNS